ncbi:serine/threonine protein kinase [Lentzea tibetensis]|uniref:non-specific serine/threonine protein kinase n=1 Tax=Lentzea tibetensis TaxID=2591470 RepID=A0A563EI73_9PSEU|nr:serine/threonine protein kinase [Lentzea tibetensis]
MPGLTNLRPLGEGGFATVYRAHQAQLGRDVAVKIDNRVLGSERDRRRFLREGHAAAKLSGHPNVVGVFDANITPQGTPYLVMELCDNGSLADRIRQRGPMPAEEVRQLGIQLADALAAAHADGVLHRDIKPGNILVDRYGTAKLADFGLAALLDAQGSSTVTRDALSPSYAPPEAFAMAQPTPQADVYSLAATLYDLLAGKPPRPVPWPIESFDHLGEVLRSPVPPVAGVPQALHDVLARGLHPESSMRTASAVQLRDELRAAQPMHHSVPQHQQHQPIPQQHSVPQRHTGPAPAPKNKNVLAVLGATALVVVVVVGIVLWANRDKPGQTNPGNGGESNVALESTPPFLKDCGTGTYCMTEPTCYHGITEIGGQVATARRAGDCSVEHYWEAFSGGWFSGEIPKVGSDELVTAPEVKNVCTKAVMGSATRPTVDTSTWEIAAIGFADGKRNYFHCLGAPEEGGEFTTSAFGS